MWVASNITVQSQCFIYCDFQICLFFHVCHHRRYCNKRKQPLTSLCCKSVGLITLVPMPWGRYMFTTISKKCTGSIFMFEGYTKQTPLASRCWAYSSTLKMEAGHSSEMSIHFYQTAWHQIPKDMSHLYYCNV